MFSFNTKGQLLNSPSDMPILWRKEMKRILQFLNEELADKGILESGAVSKRSVTERYYTDLCCR